MLRCIDKTGQMGGREKEDKEGGKDEEAEEDPEESAVNKAGKRPSWKENGHKGKERELSSIPQPSPTHAH